MSRKSSWWLRPQRKGASNRAALNEANYFMEHNKALQERINELAAENAKLRALTREIWRSCPVSEDDCAKCPHHIGESDEDWCDIPILMEELGVEVDE